MQPNLDDPGFIDWKKKNLSAARLQEMYPDTFFPGGFTLRDEANAIVAYAFRNGPIEDLHAGKDPNEYLDRLKCYGFQYCRRWKR